MTAPIARSLHDEFLRDVNDAIDRMTLGGGEGPTQANVPRYARVVVAYDGSDGAKLALAWAKAIAQKHDSTVLVANAYRPPDVGGANLGVAWYSGYNELYEEAERWSRNVANETASELRADKVDAKSYSFEGSAWREIAKLAGRERADLVITGAARRHALGRVFLGSTAMGLVEHAPCSVLVARNAPPVRRVLAATDGSAASYRAVAHALGLARALDAELVVQHVLEYPDGVEERAPAELLRGVADRIELPAPPARARYVVDVGPAAARILHREETEHAGLVAVGAHGKGVLERALVGSVSRRVAAESRASVLVTKT